MAHNAGSGRIKHAPTIYALASVGAVVNVVVVNVAGIPIVLGERKTHPGKCGLGGFVAEKTFLALVPRVAFGTDVLVIVALAVGWVAVQVVVVWTHFVGVAWYAVGVFDADVVDAGMAPGALLDVVLGAGLALALAGDDLACVGFSLEKVL